MNRIRISRYLTLFGYFGLLGLLFLWQTILEPSTLFPVSIVIIVFIGPLMFPLRGILYGRPYTHALTSFLALLYFTHGVVEAYGNADERVYALLEILFSVSLYMGAMLFARFRGKEIKQEHAESQQPGKEQE